MFKDAPPEQGRSSCPGTILVRTVLRSLPAVLVSTSLALAGLLAIGQPLIKWHLNYCGFGTLTVLQWWAIAALGALVGGLLLCVYHTWAVRRGFTAWSTLLWDTGAAGDGTNRFPLHPGAVCGSGSC